MPIPKPNKGEKQTEFIARCMGDSTMGKDYPKISQRYAICIGEWGRKKEDNPLSEATDEFIQNLKNESNTED